MIRKFILFIIIFMIITNCSNNRNFDILLYSRDNKVLKLSIEDIDSINSQVKTQFFLKREAWEKIYKLDMRYGNIKIQYKDKNICGVVVYPITNSKYHQDEPHIFCDEFGKIGSLNYNDLFIPCILDSEIINLLSK